MSATDVQEKFKAGASLVQIYTGLIYRGPSLVKEIIFDLKNQN
jgi:dihydroorotate dehydrogenase